MPNDTLPKPVSEQVNDNIRDFLYGFLVDKETRDDFMDERFIDGFAVALMATSPEPYAIPDCSVYQEYVKQTCREVIAEIDAA